MCPVKVERTVICSQVGPTWIPTGRVRVQYQETYFRLDIDDGTQTASNPAACQPTPMLAQLILQIPYLTRNKLGLADKQTLGRATWPPVAISGSLSREKMNQNVSRRLLDHSGGARRSPEYAVALREMSLLSAAAGLCRAGCSAAYTKRCGMPTWWHSTTGVSGSHAACPAPSLQSHYSTRVLYRFFAFRSFGQYR
ncbi:hypothetical protein LZ30DRAFT_378116 [Colletotrichum cereale]|nr:hypothetical protein LZ30DRAFT_378116 [Colletotrichum cereale]